MLLLDYLPALLAFLFAILATLSKTKDQTKSGIRSITRSGWCLVVLSMISLLYGGFAIHQTHDIQSKREVIAGIARNWMVNGVNLLLKPLCGTPNITTSTDTAAKYRAFRSRENLDKVGKQRAVQRPGMGGLVSMPTSLTPYHAFEEPYQLYDYIIRRGEDAVMRALRLFGTHLTEEEIIAVSTLLSDEFLNGNYRLAGKTMYFELGLEDERKSQETSPWNTIGLHYFNAVYKGVAARKADLQPVTEFLAKAEKITMLLHGENASAAFAPCTK